MKTAFCALLISISTALAGSPDAFEIRAVANGPGPEVKEYRLEVPGRPPQKVLLNPAALMDGSDLHSTKLQENVQADQFEVLIVFTEAGAKKFGEITAQNVGKQLAIVVGGKLLSAPRVNEPILGGSAAITGSWSKEEAEEILRAVQGAIQ